MDAGAVGATRDPEALLGDATALWVVHHDYWGIARGKVVPPARFAEVMRDGVTFSRVAWDFTITSELVPDAGYSLASGDFHSVPDPATLVRLPHVPGVVQAFSSLVDDGSPWIGDPRARLRAAVDDLASLGYRVLVALESEFQVVVDDETGDWAPVETLPMFAIAAVEGQWRAWAGPVLEALAAAGVPVHQFAREGDVGQFELSLLPADPVRACDQYLLARQVVKGLVPPGLVATFMPKLREDRAGNGLHVHLSLWDEQARPALVDPHDPQRLSSAGLSAVASLVAHAPGQAALATPTPNSYRRLVPGWGAPTHATWSMGNRSALVRIPGPGSGRRVEYRSGDQSGNPYLHVLGLLAAVAAGIRSGTPPIPAQDRDLALLRLAEIEAIGAPRLPRDVPAALEALAADPVLTAALGPVIVEHYTAAKRHEHATFLRATGGEGDAVTDWERRTYLRAL